VYINLWFIQWNTFNCINEVLSNVACLVSDQLERIWKESEAQLWCKMLFIGLMSISCGVVSLKQGKWNPLLLVSSDSLYFSFLLRSKNLILFVYLIEQ
jgi:hypothetical protein